MKHLILKAVYLILLLTALVLLLSSCSIHQRVKRMAKHSGPSYKGSYAKFIRPKHDPNGVCIVR